MDDAIAPKIIHNRMIVVIEASIDMYSINNIYTVADVINSINVNTIDKIIATVLFIIFLQGMI
jgi:hypothetical protein